MNEWNAGQRRLDVHQINRADVCLAGYGVIQFLGLICLRRFYLLTVYQTAAFYLAVSLAGDLLLLLRMREEKFRKIRDCYLVLWSSVHGIIVLGFLTKGTFYLTLTQMNIIQVINFFLGFAVYWVCYMAIGRLGAAVGIGNLIVGVMGVVNRYLVRFRGAPFQISDIRAMQTAGNVMQNYDYTPDLLMLAALADLIIWSCLLWRVGKTEAKKRQRFSILHGCVTAMAAIGCLMLFVGPYPELYARTGQFARDSYLAELLADARGSIERYPEGYSKEEAERILSDVAGTVGDIYDGEETLAQKPNIVVIMNEAFSDLRVLGEFATDEPFLEYWDSLQENCVKGYANVSVLGGTTANSEFEFLSSDATALFLNGGIPYNDYFASGESYLSLVSVLAEQGYETTAFHPYLSSGWNRTVVYRAMQFEHIIFSEDLTEELDKLRLYVSDQGDYSYIMDWFEAKEAGRPQFFFNVTMQNHGGYTYKGEDFETAVQLAGDKAGAFPQAEQYLSLIRESDQALKGLLEYFETYEEPVVVVLFGDHQPNLEPEFYEYITGGQPEVWGIEQRANQYKTPFLIWHNYDTKFIELEDVSLNYLAPIVLSDAGLSMSDYQAYLLGKMEELPVVNAVMAMDSDGNVYAKGSAEYGEMTREMQMLVYYHTVDGG